MHHVAGAGDLGEFEVVSDKPGYVRGDIGGDLPTLADGVGEGFAGDLVVAVESFSGVVEEEGEDERFGIGEV